MIRSPIEDALEKLFLSVLLTCFPMRLCRMGAQNVRRTYCGEWDIKRTW